MCLSAIDIGQEESQALKEEKPGDNEHDSCKECLSGDGTLARAINYGQDESHAEKAEKHEHEACKESLAFVDPCVIEEALEGIKRSDTFHLHPSP